MINAKLIVFIMNFIKRNEKIDLQIFSRELNTKNSFYIYNTSKIRKPH